MPYEAFFRRCGAKFRMAFDLYLYRSEGDVFYSIFATYRLSPHQGVRTSSLLSRQIRTDTMDKP